MLQSIFIIFWQRTRIILFAEDLQVMVKAESIRRQMIFQSSYLLCSMKLCLIRRLWWAVWMSRLCRRNTTLWSPIIFIRKVLNLLLAVIKMSCLLHHRLWRYFAKMFITREIFWASINTRYRLRSSVLRCLCITLILTLAKTHRCDGTHIQF